MYNRHRWLRFITIHKIGFVWRKILPNNVCICLDVLSPWLSYQIYKSHWLEMIEKDDIPTNAFASFNLSYSKIIPSLNKIIFKLGTRKEILWCFYIRKFWNESFILAYFFWIKMNVCVVSRSAAEDSYYCSIKVSHATTSFLSFPSFTLISSVRTSLDIKPITPLLKEVD